jgi:RNA polymerase sigma-54 factor
MALSQRLEMRQGQALVMTPQLLQAIKLLQLSTLDLAAYVETELERNPLLERVEAREDVAGAPERDASGTDTPADPASGDWLADDVSPDRAEIEARMGTSLDNVFQDERPGDPDRATAGAEGPESLPTASLGWIGGGGGGFDGDEAGFEAFVAAEISLHDHLARQLHVATRDSVERAIGEQLIDLVDETGYIREPLDELAGRLGVDPARVEAVLALIQGFEPTGVGARGLAECLSLQLAERDRLDPAMQALLAHLDLVARRDFAALSRICGVDRDDIADMLAELRELDPRPGLAFGHATAQPVVPDVFVRPASDGSWVVELNADVLPRVLVNQTYFARVCAHARSEADKSFLTDCLQNANWLTRSLEQRARTILKVASEIVRQQDAFLIHGIEHLRPLNLKTIADAIGMHESTVSRVTSNKYIATPRGLFEMKFFFTAALASAHGGEAHSAEAVRFRIRQLVEAESADDVLSDDAIVQKLREAGIEIARRTVAKYRESLGIPSSVERRREKAALARRVDAA